MLKPVRFPTQTRSTSKALSKRIHLGIWLDFEVPQERTLERKYLSYLNGSTPGWALLERDRSHCFITRGAAEREPHTAASTPANTRADTYSSHMLSLFICVPYRVWTTCLHPSEPTNPLS